MLGRSKLLVQCTPRCTLLHGDVKYSTICENIPAEYRGGGRRHRKLLRGQIIHGHSEHHRRPRLRRVDHTCCQRCLLQGGRRCGGLCGLHIRGGPPRWRNVRCLLSFEPRLVVFRRALHGLRRLRSCALLQRRWRRLAKRSGRGNLVKRCCNNSGRPAQRCSQMRSQGAESRDALHRASELVFRSCSALQRRLLPLGQRE